MLVLKADQLTNIRVLKSNQSIQNPPPVDSWDRWHVVDPRRRHSHRGRSHGCPAAGRHTPGILQPASSCSCHSTSILNHLISHLWQHILFWIHPFKFTWTYFYACATVAHSSFSLTDVIFTWTPCHHHHPCSSSSLSEGSGPTELIQPAAGSGLLDGGPVQVTFC